MTNDTIILILTWLKPLAYLVGMMAILFMVMLWLFRDQIGKIVFRLLFRNQRNSSDDDEDDEPRLPRRRYEDHEVDELLRMWERCAQAQEENAKNLAINGTHMENLVERLGELKDSIEKIAHEMRESVGLANKRIDAILMQRTEGN